MNSARNPASSGSTESRDARHLPDMQLVQPLSEAIHSLLSASALAMGVPSEWRKFLFALLAKQNCFFENMPTQRASTPFDVVIVDSMQELALMKHGDAYQTGPAIAEHMKRSLYRHLVHAGNGDVVTARLLIACFDNAYAVPRNKAFTEAGRDGADTLITNTTAFNALVNKAREIRVLTERHGMHESASASAVALNASRVRADFDPRTHFLVSRHGDLPDTGERVWRNACLSWQLKRLATQACMEMFIPEGLTLLVDDGIVLTEAQYAPLAADMLRDHGYDGPSFSPFARAGLIGQLMSSRVERVLVQPQHRHTTLPSTGIGEADHKILYYVQRALPLGLPRTAGRPGSYLVKCQDTDVLWALLLHVGAALINPTTGAVDEVDVWIDTQMPSDRATGTSRPYRFVNVVQCWRALHSTLVREFPTLKNPVEAFIALVFCNANDFVEPFAAPLKLGAGTIWNTWAQALCLGAGREDYPSFSQEGKRTKVSPTFPRELAGAFDDWVVYRAPPSHSPAAPCLLQIKSAELTRFFYGLVQRSPLLSGYAKRLETKSPWAQRGGPFETNHDNLMETLTHLVGLLVAEGDTDVPPLLAVPPPAAMRARCARVNWTIDCYANGWKTKAYAYNWFAATGEYSRNGWSARDVTDSSDVSVGAGLTSQYLYAEYCAPHINTFGVPVLGRYRLYSPQLAYEVDEPVY